MKVFIPSPLRFYTGNSNQVEANGSTISELLNDLEKQFEGFRFRIINELDEIREHIRIFVNQELINSLNTPISARDTIHIIAALSGG